MNVKLHQVISEITGKTGLAIVEDVVGGERARKSWRNSAAPGLR